MTTHFSGRFLLRIPRTLHAELSRRAEAEGVSLNQYIATLLAGAVAWQGRGGPKPGVPMGVPGYVPDHAQERHADFLRSTPGQRVAEAISLSRTATRIAAAGAAARKGS